MDTVRARNYNKFRLGGGTDSNWGTDSGESKPPTHKFQILLGFRTLYFGNIGKPENFGKYSENFLLKFAISLGAIPRISNREREASPHPTPEGDVHAYYHGIYSLRPGMDRTLISCNWLSFWLIQR